VYAAHGLICLLCERARKADHEKRKQEIISLVDESPTTDAKEAKEKSKLDAALALKLGARALNQIAPSVLARLAQYADDPDSEFHGMALEFFAQRLAPRKLYEELGGEAAGLGAMSDRRPQFIVNVMPATAPAPAGRVIDSTSEVTEFKVLPSPTGSGS
jgi:hypothetical protein